MKKKDFDVGIIGGGPAGSATAAYLAKAGLKCVVLERELFPRPHVGESLVPCSTRVFKELGFIDQMDEAGFVKKYGAAWTADAKAPVYEDFFDGLESDVDASIRFEERPQPGVDRNYTWHVDRGKFDLLLLKHAQKLGAEIYEGCKVSGVDFTDPASPQIKYRVNGKEMSTKVSMCVDASGRHTLLGNQLKLKRPDPVFNQYALHTWFEGFDRRVLAKKENHRDHIFIHYLPISNSWIWQIPISEDVTSIGVVTQKKHFEKSRASREKFFWDCIGSRPELLAVLKASHQLRPLKEEGDYSYGMSQICGDGFVLVGDAARFVDPIFSSGVSIALNCGRLASQDIVKAAEKGNFDKERFEEFATTIRWGTSNWYKFITLYYRLHVLFTAFVQDERYRLDVIKLLQGDVYEPEAPEVLKEMDRIATAVEQNENHPLHPRLGTLFCEASKPAF